MVSVFDVVENNKTVFRGDRKEVAERFGIAMKSVYSYAYNDRLLYGKYRVKVSGKRMSEVSRKAQEKKEKKEIKPDMDYSNDKLNTLAWHLKTYGNTSVSFDPVKYLPDLYDMGLNCRVKEIPSYVEERRVTKSGRKPKVKYNYLVEVASAERKRESI